MFSSLKNEYVKSMVVGIILLNFLIGLLALVNFIPISAIQSNVYTSIEDLNKEKEEKSIWKSPDLNADAVVMNIALNKECSVDSVFKPKHLGITTSKYLIQLNSYLDGDETVNEYVQYWHGYRVLWYPLFTVLSIKGILALAFTIVLLLILVTSYLISKDSWIFGMVWFTASSIFLLSSCVSLEYVPVTLITLISTLLILRSKPTLTNFICIGIVTMFFDFLTAETLTFTIPYLITLWKYKTSIKDGIKLGLGWLLGYVGTLGYKYLLMTIIYQENYFTQVKTIFEEHFENYSNGISVAMQMNLIVVLGEWVMKYLWIVALLAVVTIVATFIFRSKSISDSYWLQLCVLCTIPYLRYAVLDTHSLLLYYFTYRAQMVVPLCLYIMMYDNELVRLCKKKIGRGLIK